MSTSYTSIVYKHIVLYISPWQFDRVSLADTTCGVSVVFLFSLYTQLWICLQVVVVDSLVVLLLTGNGLGISVLEAVLLQGKNKKLYFVVSADLLYVIMLLLF